MEESFSMMWMLLAIALVAALLIPGAYRRERIALTAFLIVVLGGALAAMLIPLTRILAIA